MGRLRQHGLDATGRIHCRIHPVAAARMAAYCEWRTRETGVSYTLTMLLNDFGWSLRPVAPEIERQLRIRQGGIADNEATTQSEKSPAAAGRLVSLKQAVPGDL